MNSQHALKNNDLSNNTLARDAKIFWWLWVVQTRYWADNVMNLFLGIGVSLYTMVCWLAFKSGDPFLMVSGISVGIVRNGLYIYQKTLVDWRAQGTIKKFETLPIPKYIRSLSTVTFNFVSTTLIAAFMFAIAMLCFPAQRDLLPNANSAVVVTGFLVTWFVSYLVGTVIYLYIKNAQISQMTGLLAYFTSLYFLGLAFPIETIMQPQYHWLSDILYLWPMRFGLNIVQAGFANSPYAYKLGEDGIHYVVDYNHYTGLMNIVNFPLFDNAHNALIGTDGKQKTVSVDFGFNGKLWIAYIGALAWSIFYGGLAGYKTTKNFIFHERTEYGKMTVNATTSKYVSALRKAGSIEEIEMLHKERIAMLKGQNKIMSKVVEEIQNQEKNNT